MKCEAHAVFVVEEERNLIYECDMISKIEFVVPTLPNYIFLFDKRLPNYIIYFLLYIGK
jgi:hypothetical protein